MLCFSLIPVFKNRQFDPNFLSKNDYGFGILGHMIGQAKVQE